MSLGEPHVKQAVDWILARLANEPNAKRSALIDEASREFDLTPIEADFLFRHLQEMQKEKPPGAPRS